MRIHRKIAVAILAVGTLLVALLLSGCGASSGPDLTPLGNGLSVIGLGIVLAAFIRVLGNKWAAPEKPERSKPRAKPR